MATRESCLRLRQRLSIVVTGYEGESGALFDDEVARSWIYALDREFPYWMFFQHPEGRWLKLASIWLGNPSRSEGGEICVDPEAYAATVRNWFMALNHLSYVVGIDAEVHQAISSQAYELLRSG